MNAGDNGGDNRNNSRDNDAKGPHNPHARRAASRGKRGEALSRGKAIGIPTPVAGSGSRPNDIPVPAYLDEFPEPYARAMAVQYLRGRLIATGQWDAINALSWLTADRSAVRWTVCRNVVEDHRVNEDTAVREAAMAVHDMAGMIPFGYGHADGEPDRGSVFREVRGKPETGHEASTRGLKAFGYHLDWGVLPFPALAGADEPRMPDWVMLICKSNPDLIGTLVQSTAKAIPYLSDMTKYDLTGPHFRMPAPGNIDPSFAAEGVPALEFTSNRVPMLRHHPEMVGLTPRAKEALIELREVLDQMPAEEVVLHPGDALILSNVHTLHARKEVSPHRELMAIYGRAPSNRGPGFEGRPYLERYCTPETANVLKLR
ncbi:MAG: hypothetical protein RLO01_13415 [Thalassobaculaceae bacterium]